MGIFDRFYYGKAGKADYTEDDLPVNRFQLFGQVFRVRFWSLMRLNLMQVVFWLPVIVITLMTLLGAVTMATDLLEQEASLAEMSDQLLGLLSTFGVLLIPCILITGPSSAAAAHVARNWARDQHSFLWSDFSDALKENWKQGLCASAISAVIPYLMLVGIAFYGEAAQTTTPLAVGGQVLVILMGVIWALGLTFLYPLMVGYQLRMGKLIRNALLLAVARLPFVAALRLALLLPLVVGLLMFYYGGMYGLLVIGAYYLLIGFALNRLASASFANGVFDKYINPNIEGAPVNLGLRADEDDEDEE
ncbi:MAG: YesL family protein [Clostridia bacterium]|nr:YesL family protein [Clostridia bacterium]